MNVNLSIRIFMVISVSLTCDLPMMFKFWITSLDENLATKVKEWKYNTESSNHYAITK
jgi:hypothetical protein